MQNNKTDPRVEDVPKPIEVIQASNQQTGQSGCPECQEETGRLRIDQYLDAQCFTGTKVPGEQSEKVRFRYDRRIGGWRRTY